MAFAVAAVGAVLVLAMQTPVSAQPQSSTDFVRLLEDGSDCAPDNSVCIVGNFNHSGDMAYGCQEARSYTSRPYMGSSIYDANFNDVKYYGQVQTTRRDYQANYNGRPRPFNINMTAHTPRNNNFAELSLTAD